MLGLRASTVNRRTPFAFDFDAINGWEEAAGVIRPVTVDGLAGTFSRAGQQTAVDGNGRVYTVPAGFPALYYIYNAGVWSPVGVLLERASTNICYPSSDFGTSWSAIGSPTRTAQAARCGVVYLDLLSDLDIAGLAGYSRVVTCTGDAVKAVSFLFRKSSGTSHVVRWRDTSASANRLLAAITWSGSTPVITMTTGVNLVTTPERLQGLDGATYWRCYLQTTSVTAANTNQIEIYPGTDAALSTSGSGVLYVGGVQVEDNTFPTSLIQTVGGTASRVVSSLAFPLLFYPRDATSYLKVRDMGTLQVVSNRLAQFGATGNDSTNSFYIQCNAAGDARLTHNNGTTAVSADNATGAVGVLDTMELRAAVLAAGPYTGRTINGAAEVVGSAASALAFNTAFAETLQTYTPDSTFIGAHILQRSRLAFAEQTLAVMNAGV